MYFQCYVNDLVIFQCYISLTNLKQLKQNFTDISTSLIHYDTVKHVDNLILLSVLFQSFQAYSFCIYAGIHTVTKAITLSVQAGTVGPMIHAHWFICSLAHAHWFICALIYTHE